VIVYNINNLDFRRWPGLDNFKRVMISLPDSLLKDIDGFIKEDSSNDRSEFIKEAMRLYLKEKKRQEIREKLRDGYLEMSDFNQKLADEGIEYDTQVMIYYEDSLAECE